MSLAAPDEDAAPHAIWCATHTAEGCLSGAVSIPGMPFAIWATRPAGADPDTIRLVVDGEIHDGTTVIDLRLTHGG